MIPTTLKTIFTDGDLDDSSLLLDVQQPYRDKDLLTNQFDDVEEDVHDQNSPFFGLFPPTSDALSNTLLSTYLSHDSSGSSSNGSSAAFSFTDSAYASSSSPPPSASKVKSSPHSNNTTSQSISIMRGLQAQPQPPHHHQQQQQQQQQQQVSQSLMAHSSLLTGLNTSSPSSSLSSIHSSTIDHSTSSFFPKQRANPSQPGEEYHYDFWHCPMCQETYQRNRPQLLQCFHAFCEPCIEKLAENDEGGVSCPSCGLTTQLADIVPDCTLQDQHENVANDYMMPLGDNSSQCCTACKSAESMAVAKCFQCSSFLCRQCVCAHQLMNCFEGHRVSNDSCSHVNSSPSASDPF